MKNPFELVFTNILFFYPDFRSVDTVEENYQHLLQALSGDCSHLGERGLMVYVHIPFCRHLCRFCGYHRKRLARSDTLSRYVDRLVAEIRQWSARLDGRPPVSALYFGGGTPTVLSADDFSRLLASLRETFVLSKDTQFDIESDMAALQARENISALRAAGVKRISFGIQSLDDQVRRIAGIRQFKDGGYLTNCIDNLRNAGYSLNYDLMFGLPGQSFASFMGDIERSVHDVAADHIDILEFFPQPEAFFTRHFDRFEGLVADRKTRRVMYTEARKYLLQNGFRQHSLSDFWREGMQPSRFKSMLYRNADIIGFGAGSHGILGNCAFRNRRLDEGYMDNPGQYWPFACIRPLSPELRRTRSLILLPKLLRFSGTDFPGGMTDKEASILERFIEQKQLLRTGDAYEVTELGMLTSADMMLDILASDGDD
jgi:coproporphyrinogen III oxidase-like Fe-S oxidoreductase